MLMIRFQRIGRKNDPAFRIAVLEKQRGPKAGKYVDLVGTYNPKTKETNLKPDLIKDWVAKGAQVSPSVHNLLISKGVMEGKKINVLPKKTAPVKVVAEAPVQAAPEAPSAHVAETEESDPEPTPETEAPASEETPTEVEPTPEVSEEPAPAEEAPAAE